MNSPNKTLVNSYCSHKKVKLAPGQIINLNVTGRFMICSEATGPFTLRINGGEELPWSLGLSFTCDGGDYFTGLTFANPSITEDIIVEIIYGVGVVDDKRLNIVRARPSQLWLQQSPTVIKTAGITSLAAGASLALPGTGAVGSGYAHRKSVTITNNDPAVDLELKQGANSLATIFFRQAWQLETSADLVLHNPNGTPVNCRVVEVFYIEN